MDRKSSRKLSYKKGRRLNWTPIEKAEKVNLKEINVSGKRVSSEAIQRGKKFVDSNKHVLIP